MWRFHRYYIKEFLLNLSLTFVMLFGICLLALVARGIYRSQGLDLVIGLWITLLWTVDAIPHVLSISVLVASVFTFGRAAADNEITAMRMTGTSPLRLMGGVLFVGAMTASINAWLLHNTIPLVHYYKYRPTSDALKLLLMSNRSRQNKMEFRDFTMVWERKDGLRYYQVAFNATSRQGNFVGSADELEIEHNEAEEALVVKARNFEGDQETGDRRFRIALQTLRLTFSLSEILEKNKRAEGMKDVSTAQLVAEVDGGTGERTMLATWFIWLRSCQSLASLLFAIIGFPIGVVFRRAGRMVSFAISFLPLALYYGLMYVAPWVARETNAVWPVFIPDAGLLLLALILGRRAFRQ